MLKKVIVFIPAIEKGGVERNAIWVANKMAEQGLEVDILYVRAEAGQLEKLNATVNKVRFERKSNKWVNQRIMDAISVRSNLKQYLLKQDSKTTVLIAFQSASVAIGVCKKVGIKVVCRLSSHPNAIKYTASIVRKGAEWIKPYTYKKADVVIANSKRMAEDFSKKINRKVETIYNPIDFEKVDVLQKEKLDSELQKEWEEYEGKLIVSVGRLSFEKDYQTMIKGYALSHCSKSGMLWIVGEGRQREELEKLVAELGVQEHVHFLGYKENVYKYMKAADLFLLTSMFEGCPNALIEATSVGVPAIATDCLSGPSEVLLDGKGGVLITVGDAESLAREIDAYFNDKAELRAKCDKAQAYMERFAGKRILQQYMDLFKRVLND